jgi:hypothetical protein
VNSQEDRLRKMLPRRYACYLSFLVAAATALQPSSLPRRLSPAPRSDLRCVRLADDGNPLLRALAGLGQSALSKLEKEMQTIFGKKLRVSGGDGTLDLTSFLNVNVERQGRRALLT